MTSTRQKKGISAALTSALFLGLVPVFGKLAIGYGFTPFAVIAIRTSIAALLMVVAMFLTMRQFFYIYPVGLVGCLLAGFINGLGSILYYNALSRMDAGIGHILYSLYPVFVAVWLVADRQPITPMTAIRLTLTIPAVYLLILPGGTAVDRVGAVMMIGSAFLYALHMLINQRILYEAPAPTVTLYTLLSMAVTVDLAFLIMDRHVLPLTAVWWPVLSMAAITFFSRLALFFGIKHLGGLQTALLGLAELFVTVLLAQIWLGEHLSLVQWMGAFLLSTSLLLAGAEKFSPPGQSKRGWLSWLNRPSITRSDVPWKNPS
jgi:drug/metabolite transporter (DMT)-like permease